MKARDRVEWRGLHDGPWPILSVQGQLERAEQEWLHTNGAGAYAMSTAALMHTRREHGILVAPLGPEFERYVVLSHAETVLEVGRKTYRLASHQFPNVAPTPGYRLLEIFAQDPLPRWVFRCGKGTLERTLCLVRGESSVVVSYTWSGKTPARLAVRPLMPLRPASALAHEHGAMMQRVTLRPFEVEVQPVPELPSITFGHEGVFMGSPDWWRRFEYLGDRGRYDEFQEDMWTPGVFEVVLEPRKTSYIVASVGKLPARPPAELVMETAEYLLAGDPGFDQSPTVRALCIAADDFCVGLRSSLLNVGDEARLERVSRSERFDRFHRIIAGYPWLGLFSRDAAISVIGLMLTRERYDEAADVLRGLLRQLQNGVLPLRVLPEANPGHVVAPDAALWLFDAVRDFADCTSVDHPFVAKEAYPKLCEAFHAIENSDPPGLWLTTEGFLANGAEGRALTWMDAKVGERLITPRRGVAIELQALWTNACDVLARLSHAYGDSNLAFTAEALRDQCRSAVRARFWCNETEYPFDCLSEALDTAEAWADPSVRPNALIALAVDPSLFEHWQARAILARVERDLLTPRGVRTLIPSDARYVGHVSGTASERVSAFHQGTVWPHLLGAYVRASVGTFPEDPQLRLRLRELVESAVEGGPVLGHVAQLADGDEPHRPRGCPAQAFSTAELLRVLTRELAE